MAKGTKLNERAVTILFAKMDRLRSSERALHEWALLGINIHSGRSVVQSHPGHAGRPPSANFQNTGPANLN